MKLWQKVSLLCVCVLLAVVIVCSALLLNSARNSILLTNIQATETRHFNLLVSFSTMVYHYLDDDASPVVKLSGIKYCFERCADASSVLMRDGETLHSSVSIDPSEYLHLPLYGERPSGSYVIKTWENISLYPMVLEEIYDRNVLIAGATIKMLGDEYKVYTANDITEAYNNIALLARRLIAICAVSVIIGTVLIIALVRFASQPLITLKNITRRIAVGEYGQRAEIRTRDDIAELAADFNEMAEAVQVRIAELEDTAERRQLFIGGLTHELKTPMASILLHSETLMTADLSSEEARRSLMHLHEQCRWLERLSQKLLVLITLDQCIQVQPENIGKLINDVYNCTAETLKERNSPLIVECDTEAITVDYDLIKSLLINLIENASKASEPGQEIILRAYDSTIEISDSGVGIPPEEVIRVTDAFYVGDRSRNKKTGGSGLGLALAKRIADAHGAEFIIDSEPTVGTTVRVVFPDVSNC